MQKEKKSNSISLLLQWAGKEKYWMYLAVILSFFSGICTMIPYYGIYSLMSAVYTGTCTTEFVIRDAGIIAGGIVIRFLLFGASGVASHKGAYRALLKVRCMVIDHMAKVPLGALNECSTGEIKTVLNEDIEKLELFLAHNVPELPYRAGGGVYLPSDRKCTFGIGIAGAFGIGVIRHVRDVYGSIQHDGACQSICC